MRRPAARHRRASRPIDYVAIVAILASGLLGATAATFVTAPKAAQAGTELLPDLAMAPLGDFRIDSSNGRRLLRFTAMMVNVGDGHFELRGSRAGTTEPMRLSQVFYDTTARNATPVRQELTNAVASYAGDGHDHWHVNEMMRYDMWGPGGNVFRGAKVGFCFLDSDPWATSLPGYAGSYYRNSMCSTNPNVLSNRMGISVGWGDEYEYYLAWQWIDITSAPAGTYTVRATVDPYGVFTETDDTNQCAWATVRIGSGTAVQVTASGRTCVNDIDNSIFAGDIGWAYDEGITVGCAPNLFCTSGPVTREQMASFLARALDLPPAQADHFADDTASPHQADINRLYEAGITGGCADARFCPRSSVTREQMASFLARAYGLTASGVDHFADDDDSIHQAAINAIADAGVTGGCASSEYCPRSAVTRGQMAAFLHRAAE